MDSSGRKQTDGSAIIWKHHDSWVNKIGSLLKPMVKSGAISRIRKTNTSRLYADDPLWLGLLEAELKICDIDELILQLSEQLRRFKIRGFHGCRPFDIESYYKDGIRVHRRADMIQRAEELIRSDARLQRLLPQFIKRFDKFDSALDEGKVYLVLDDRALLRSSSHYLIYGSEWIACVLGEGYRQPLLERGVPTLFEIEFPLSLESTQGNQELARLLIREWTRFIAVRPREPIIADFSFMLTRDIPTSMIVDHSHPRSIRNPWDGKRDYTVDPNLCPVCRNSATLPVR